MNPEREPPGKSTDPMPSEEFPTLGSTPEKGPQRPDTSAANSQPQSNSSPEELHDRVKDAVARALSAAAGALEGFSEQMRERHIADQASDTIHQIGDATRKVTEASKEEVRKVGDSTASLTTASREAAQTVRDAAGSTEVEQASYEGEVPSTPAREMRREETQQH